MRHILRRAATRYIRPGEALFAIAYTQRSTRHGDGSVRGPRDDLGMLAARGERDTCAVRSGLAFVEDGYCDRGRRVICEQRDSIAGMHTVAEGPAAGASEASSRPANVRAAMVALVPIVGFDIVGPIIAQSLARNQGASLTVALAISGAPPAAWILVGMMWRRRMDAVGAFVLSSIILATLIGLATGSGRLYLLDSAILTGVFGLVCLASVATRRPLMFHFALAFNGGVESPRGRDFADRWRYAAFRRVFVVMTVVWGLAFVFQAAINAAIIEATSTDRAFVINKILPYLFLAVLGAWTIVYGVRAKRRGEARAARTAVLSQQQGSERVPGRRPSD